MDALLDAPSSGRLAAAPVRCGGSRTLPTLIAVTLLAVAGMVARDHFLPVLRPADAGAEVVAHEIPVHAVTPAAEPVGAARAVRPAPRSGRSPLLNGSAAEQALRQRQRDAVVGKVQRLAPSAEAPPAL